MRSIALLCLTLVFVIMLAPAAATALGPVIDNVNGDAATYYQGGAAVYLDVGQDAVVTDPNSTNFDGGTLSIAFSTGGVEGEDFIDIDTDGTGIAVIETGVGAFDVSVDGTVIGSGTASFDATVVISLNANATPAAVQRVIRAGQYFNAATPESITLGQRSVTMTLSDGTGGDDVVTTTVDVVEQGIDVAFVDSTAAGPESLADPQLIEVTTTGGNTLRGGGVLIGVSFSSSATLGEDFTIPQQNDVSAATSTYQDFYEVNIPAGTANGAIISAGLTVVNDEAEEDDEDIDLVIYDSQGVTIGSPTNIIYTIQNDDDDPPTITNTVPLQGATSVPVADNLQVTFSEDVQPTPGAARLTCQPSGNGFGAAITRSGNTFTVNPNRDLDKDSTCTLAIEVDGIQDSAGQNLVDDDGINTEDGVYTLVFNTEPEPPTVVNTTPAADAVDVAPETNLSVEFSEPVRVNRDGVTFFCMGNRVLGRLSRSADRTTYSLDPNNDLPAGAFCELSIPVGNVTDDAGNNLVDDDANPQDETYTLSFFVDEPPRITSTDPSSGATGVSPTTNIDVTVSERVRVTRRGVTFECGGNRIGGSISVNEGTYTLDPNITLPENATCTLTIPTGNIVDLTGNTLVDDDGVDSTDGVYTLSFETGTLNVILESASAEEPEQPVTAEEPPQIEMQEMEAIEMEEIEIGE